MYAIFSILYNCLQLMSFYTLVGTCTYGMVPLQHPRHWRLYSEQIHWIFRNRSENIFQFILESLFFQVTMFCPFADVYICFFRNIFIRKRYVNYTNINFCSIVLQTYSSGVLVTVTLICKQRQHSLSKSSDQEKEFDLSEANKFRVNSLECKAYNNINNKQYSTISLHFSYYLDGKMISIIKIYLITGKSAKVRAQTCEGEWEASLFCLCNCALSPLHIRTSPSHLHIFDFALSLSFSP